MGLCEDARRNIDLGGPPESDLIVNQELRSDPIDGIDEPCNLASKTARTDNRDLLPLRHAILDPFVATL